MKKGPLCKIKLHFAACMWEVFYGASFIAVTFRAIEKLHFYDEGTNKAFSSSFYMYVTYNKTLISIKKDVNLDSMLYHCRKMLEITH